MKQTAYELRKKLTTTTADHTAVDKGDAMLEEYSESSPKLPADLERLHPTLITDLSATLSTLIKEALNTTLGPILSSLENIRKTTDSYGQRSQDMEHDLSDYCDRIVELEQCTKNL